METPQDLFSDNELCSQNSPSIVAHISSSSWLKFVNQFAVAIFFKCFLVVQCFSGFFAYLFINQYLHLYESKGVFFTSEFFSSNFYFSYPQ